MSNSITKFWNLGDKFYFVTGEGKTYFEESTTGKVVRLIDETEGHQFLTPLPNNRVLFLQNSDRLVVYSMFTSTEIFELSKLPQGTEKIICVANEKFCVLAHKESEMSPTDIFLWNSSTLREYYHCHTTTLSVSALALQGDRLFVGTRGGDLYIQNLKNAHPKISLGTPVHCYRYRIRLLLPIEGSLLVKTSRGTSRFVIEHLQHIPQQYYFEKVFPSFQLPMDYSNGKLTLLKRGSIVIYDFSPSSSAFLEKFIKKLHNLSSKESYLPFLNWLFLLPQKTQDALYLHVALQHGKEDLDYGRLAFHNEEGYSATHQQRLLALRECFEEKRTTESDDSSSSIHNSSRPCRSTRQLSYNLQT